MSTLLERMHDQAVLLAKPTEFEIPEDVLALRALQAREWKPRLLEMLVKQELQAAGGQFYQDSRPPFPTAVYPTVTLSTTSKMLVPASPNMLVQPAEWWAGKKFHVRSFGKFTTAATPGNLTVEMRWATADAGGTILATSPAGTLIASKTDFSWRYEGYVTCFSTGNGGTSGSLISTGIFECHVGLVAAGYLFVPEVSAAAVTVDLATAASGISLQFKRSGSTAETATVVDQVFSAEN